MHRLAENVVYQLIEAPIGAATDATVPSTYIDVTNYERFQFIRMVGVSDDTSVTMQVVQATAAAGTGSKNVDGAALTATSLGSGANSKLAIVDVDCRKLDINNGFRYVAVTKASTGGAGSTSAILFIGYLARSAPITQGSTVAQIVHVDG